MTRANIHNKRLPDHPHYQRWLHNKHLMDAKEAGEWIMVQYIIIQEGKAHTDG